ncbi:MAG: hypothetical protein GC180_08710 [Bacteroidetes bacterium]|nr:hypothetical protein [Bacteroidota bacterium]
MQMRFINPQFLWALGVLAIPVIIHLFNFRRFKKVIFPNLRFLQEVQLQNRNKRELRKYLVLASRLLMLSFLVLAFAEPYIPADNAGIQKAGNRLSIYIDNSFSMNAESSEGALLEVAKEKARNLAMAYGETDDFQLLSNDFEARHQRAVSREAFLKWIDEIDYSPNARMLSEVLERQRNFLLDDRKENTGKLAFQISDFQKSTGDISAMKPDTNYRLFLLPLRAEGRNNLSIDSVWFDSPYVRSGQSSEIKVKVHNYGSEDITENTLQLQLNGVQKGLSSFKLEAGLSTIIELSFIPEKKGWNQAQLSIQDFPIVFDDNLYFSFEVRDYRNVLHICEDPDASREIPAVFATDSFFKFTTVGPDQMDYRSFGDYDLILAESLTNPSTGLASELKKYVENGGSLILFPNDLDAEHNNTLFLGLGLPPLQEPVMKAGEMDRVDLENPIYKEIIEKMDRRSEFPLFQRCYPMAEASVPNETLIGSGEGQEFLNLYQMGKGQVYAFLLPLNSDWSNLSHHFLFPATLLQAGFRSIPGQSLYYQIGSDVWVPLEKEKGAEDVFEIFRDKKTIIPEFAVRNHAQYLRLDDEIGEAGNYGLRKKGEAAIIQYISLNYDRKESQTTCLDDNEIEQLLPPGLDAKLVEGDAEQTGKQIKDLDAGTPLWKLAVLLALLFVSIEILLLRYLKTA